MSTAISICFAAACLLANRSLACYSPSPTHQLCEYETFGRDVTLQTVGFGSLYDVHLGTSGLPTSVIAIKPLAVVMT